MRISTGVQTCALPISGGSFSNREAKAFVSGPLFGGLRASVSGLYKRADSYYGLADDSKIKELDQDKSRGLDVHLDWQPIDEFTISASTLLTRSEGPGSIVNTVENPKPLGAFPGKIGRASCRERVCQTVER